MWRKKSSTCSQQIVGLGLGGSSSSSMSKKRMVIQEQQQKKDQNFFEAELVWLSQRLGESLRKARSILETIDEAVPPENFDDERRRTLDEIVGGLGGSLVDGILSPASSRASKVFRSLFSEDEWKELTQSSYGIQERDEQLLQDLKQKRQLKLLTEAQRVAIDLTKDEDESDEPASACASALGTLLNRVNAAKKSKKKSKKKNLLANKKSTVETAAVVVVSEKGSSSNEGEQQSPLPSRLSLPPRPSHSRPVRENRRETLMMSDGDDVDEEVEGQRGVAAAKKSGRRREKKRDRQDDRVAEESHLEELKEKMALAETEVDKWLQLLHTGGDRQVRLPGTIEAPNVRLALVAEGNAILADAQKWSRYLCRDGHAAQEDDDDLFTKIEKWGVLFRWWRFVERCFAIHGLFSCLRARQKRGTKIQARYAEEVRRRVGQGKAYSFSHASRLDRIGEMLLQYPKLVFQTQFVTQADWFEEVAAEGQQRRRHPLVDCIELVVGPEKVKWWKEPVPEVRRDAAIAGEAAVVLIGGSSCDLPVLEDSMESMNIQTEQQRCGSCNDKDQLWIFCDHVLSSQSNF